MKKAVYIFASGELVRRDNTIWLLADEDSNRAIPIEAVEELKVFGEVTLNKRLLEFLTEHHVSIHFFNHYGYYVGTFMPRDYLNSGYMILQQAVYYLEMPRRIQLARAFVIGSLSNIQKNLRYYERRGRPLTQALETIQGYMDEGQRAAAIEALMGLEGNGRRTYYESWNSILSGDEFTFTTREYRPPTNPINALISFGNALLYTTVLSEIYHTNLDPRIGYLHATNHRSHTLNLDIADVFKPVLVDRVIFELINHRRLSKRDFGQELGACYLTESGRRLVVEAYEEKLGTTIQHRSLRRRVAYRELIRMECYKLYRHFIGETAYQPFEALW